MKAPAGGHVERDRWAKRLLVGEVVDAADFTSYANGYRVRVLWPGKDAEAALTDAAQYEAASNDDEIVAFIAEHLRSARPGDTVPLTDFASAVADRYDAPLEHVRDIVLREAKALGLGAQDPYRSLASRSLRLDFRASWSASWPR